jgi:hypothetical protein
MNSKLIILLISVCAVLLLIISAEWFFAEQSQQKLLATTNATAKNTPPDEMPGVELTKRPEESYDDLVSRPLFIKGRKPVDEPKPDDAQTPAIAMVFDWELNGVYTKNKGLTALFSRSKVKVPKDNYRKVAVGGDLDGWKLAEIHKDKVILMQGGAQKELLLRKPKPKQPSLAKNRPIPPVPQSAQPSMPIPGSIPNPEIIPPPESLEEPFENSTDEQQF